MTIQEESALIGRVLAGDTDAFEPLVTENQNKVYHLALRLLGNEADAADAAQEAFLKAYTSLSGFRGDSRFSVWLYRLTNNVCLDMLRRQKRQSAVSLYTEDDGEEAELTLPDGGPGPEELLLRAEDARRTAELVSVAAVKYGDLSNQAAKDYVFDTDKFTSFEGNTGPYILYTIVRVKSILGKAEAADAAAAEEKGTLLAPASDAEKALMLDIAGLGQAVYGAYEELAPHRICAYVYQLANDLNRFYHETKILSEEDAVRRISYLRLLSLARRAMELCIDLLGFEAPEHM